MASTNIRPGNYDFKTPDGRKIGKVIVNENGDWGYVGSKQGCNSGCIKDEGDGKASFVDHKGETVGTWTKGGSVDWSDKDGTHKGQLKKP